MPEYQGDPYVGCRPECVLNPDCPRDRACMRNKCRDPCEGTCGQNALCSVVNHVPVCTCLSGMAGNAFVGCSPIPRTLYRDSSRLRSWIDRFFISKHFTCHSTSGPGSLQSVALRLEQPVSKDKRPGRVLLHTRISRFTAELPSRVRSQLGLLVNNGLQQSEVHRSLSRYLRYQSPVQRRQSQSHMHLSR